MENLELKRPTMLDMTFDLTDGYLTALWVRHPKFKDPLSGKILQHIENVILKWENKNSFK
ncbi:MAG: hypothetical protein GY820_08100 [Gammaproteobacteria bacterium]|nr:hypothetical protein [Gammaproteobacteria bacterium]